MRSIKDISIQYKFILIILTIFLVIAGISFTIFSVNETQKQTNAVKQDALLLAHCTAEYCSAPLSFDIKEETSQILHKLQSSSNIVFAAIYDIRGNLYDSFNPKNNIIQDSISNYTAFDSVIVVSNKKLPFGINNVLAKQKIIYQGIEYGTVIINLSMLETEVIIRRNIRIAAFICFVMLLLAYLLGLYFQKIITKPILTLANVSDQIKKDANYSIRIKKKNNDEIGLLYDRFNNMLEQIEIRDKKRDYTERMLEEAKNRAEDADKLKSAFLANMSHEIRTPMNSIIGFASLLADKEVNSRDRQEYVELINSSCGTLLHLIDDILDISKIEAGQITIINQKCNLSNVMNEVFLSFKEINTSSNKDKVELIQKVPPEYSNLIFDSDEIRLKQILSNLISNAIKFTHLGSIEIGVILVERIRHHERKKFLKFYIKDTGIGIDEKTQERIFDRFTKIEPDINKLYRGAGLGLTISKKLVELLGGEIWVESFPGKGSTFYFTIPSPANTLTQNNISEPAGTETVYKPLQLILNEKHVLIVEDDPANYELLKVMLKRTGASVSWAKNGIEAIDFCKTKLPDLIFMDIKMPEMDGFETISRLKEMKVPTPVIAQTAYARIEDEKKILESGFDGYLSKPIERNKLHCLLNDIFSAQFPQTKSDLNAD